MKQIYLFLLKTVLLGVIISTKVGNVTFYTHFLVYEPIFCFKPSNYPMLQSVFEQAPLA